MVANYPSRPFAGPGDLHALIRFAQEVTTARTPRASCYHPGDLDRNEPAKALYTASGFEAVEEIHTFVKRL